MARQNDIDRTMVRTACALVDWTQSDLAKAAGIALATLKRFEKGYRVPTDRTVANIFKVLKRLVSSSITTASGWAWASAFASWQSSSSAPKCLVIQPRLLQHQLAGKINDRD
jgi:transcriptional regulator with XRE-family HTH domain